MCLATLLLAAAAAGTRAYEDAAMPTLAYHWRQLDLDTTSFQRAAFRRPDLLPIFGSSEIFQTSPFHADRLFERYPSGFTIFPVSRPGEGPLTYTQQLAAMGPGLDGKKLIISVTPDLFLDPHMPVGAFQAAFWPADLYALVFHPRIRPEVKRDVAREILGQPGFASVLDDPFLRFVVERTADDSPLSRLMLAASWPMGQGRLLAYRLRDSVQAVSFLRQHGDNLSSPPAREARPLDWDALLSEASDRAHAEGRHNPLGIRDDIWQARGEEIRARQGSLNDAAFLAKLDTTTTWTMLRDLLRAARDMGAQPLVIAAPLSGRYYDLLGVSPAARQSYYDRLRALTAEEGVLLVDFSVFEDDKFFSIDPWSHPSERGWVYYARAMDAFFHEQ